MKKGSALGTWKKSLSVALVASLSIGLLSSTGGVRSVKADEVERFVPQMQADGDVTFSYRGNGTESEVYVKGSWVSDWSQYYYFEEVDTANHLWQATVDLNADTNYEYGIVVDGNWIGDPENPWNGSNSKIVRNPQVSTDSVATFYYYPKAFESAADISLCYKLVDADEFTTVAFTNDATATALFSAKTDVLNGTYEYEIRVNGEKITDYNAPSNVFTVTSIPQADPSKVSPVVNGNEVTFSYYAPLAKEVYLAGSMNEWNSSADLMEYDAATGYWNKTLTLNKGTYQYKFVADGNWFADPLNPETDFGNSVVTVTNRLETAIVSPLVEGKTVTFYYKDVNASEVLVAGSMTDWASGAKAMTKDEETGIFSLSMKLENGEYQYKFIVDGNWINDPASTDRKDGNNVFVIDAPYAFSYHIYYYKEGLKNADDAALWLWNYGIGAGSEYAFDETVELSGNTWLVADIELPYTDLGMIPKSKGSWSWQESDHIYYNTTEAASTDIYLVAEDDQVYTSLPDLNKKAETRVVLVEYERPAKDYEGWNIYTWDNGFSNTDYYFEEIDGKMVCAVPVKDSKEGFSFCMRNSTADSVWAAKDGGDHFAPIPTSQKVTKVRFLQDQGVVEVLPYNVDYEMKPEEKTVTFFYRDDALFKAYEEDSLIGKVFVIVDGVSYAMEYDSAREQYVYNWNQLTSGTHTYAYQVSGETGEAKSLEYVLFDAKVNATLSIDTMNYRQNAVLSYSFEGDCEDLQVSESYADLSALGLSDHFVINSELQATTISVLEGTTEGVKEIPVVVKDQYGNAYETCVKVTIVKSTARDFDWDEAVIYFAVTDRFFNGNKANDDAYGIGDCNITSTGSLSYHGGDFKGLTEKLDYLQSLGVNTVWITPIVENKCDGLSTDLDGVKSYGYHGYWASDFTTLNAHLGTEEEFKELVDALHARDMKIMVDVVLNHAGYETEDFFNSQLDGKNMLRDKSNTVSGDTVLDGLAGLPDFVTEDADVRNLLIEWQTSWVSEYDIDYYRIDTVKHVEPTTWVAFKNALTLINPEFKMIGEYSGAGYANDFGSLSSGQMDSLLDFDFNDKAQSFVTGNISEVESYLEKRNVAINNTAMMGQFMSSHDEDGLYHKLMNQNNISSEKAYELMKAAATLQLTMKGQPVIYYGEELGQTGADNYPYQTNRYDFDWEKAANGSDMLDHYKSLLAIRNAYTDVFAKGDRNAVLADDANGTLVFERSYGNEILYVGISLSENESEVTFAVSEKAGTLYQDLYAGNTYKVAADGTVTVKVPAVNDGGSVILVKAEDAVTTEIRSELGTWVSGSYSQGKATIENNEKRIRLTDALSVVAGNTYEASVSNPAFRMIVREVIGGKVNTFYLSNKDRFVAKENAIYYVCVHNVYNNYKDLSFDQYVTLFDAGLSFELTDVTETIAKEVTSAAVNLSLEQTTSWVSGSYAIKDASIEASRGRMRLSDALDVTPGQSVTAVITKNGQGMKEFRYIIREVDDQTKLANTFYVSNGESFVCKEGKTYYVTTQNVYNNYKELDFNRYVELMNKGYVFDLK